MNKLSRKDIEMLEMLAKTQDSKDALGEYIKQHNKAVKAYKVYRESVVAEVEVDKVVKPVETKRKFKAGDKVQVLSNKLSIANTKLRIGDITEVIRYKGDIDGYEEFDANSRPVVVVDPLDKDGEGFFEETALELTEEELKRKFKAGDKVRVLSTNGALATAGLEIGDVAEVLKYTQRDDIVMLKSPHKSWYAYFFESALELVEGKPANELRAEIIEKAKEFVKEQRDDMIVVKTDNPHGYVVGVSFIVNAEKRTVVALLRGIISDSVRAKDIAKCNPDDVFNEHIGKAIALGRALGKDVSEFENAPQPNELAVV